MEPIGAWPRKVVDAKSLKDMVGPCGLEPQTSTVSKIIKEASPFCNFYNTNKPLMLWICTTPIKVFTHKRTRQPNVPSPEHTGISSSPGQ